MGNAGWSTRQLAELAGTTVRAVRHYHAVGLVAEPERRTNGYKSYGVHHLVRVLRIRRLSGLGLSLPRVAELGEADGHPREMLSTLEKELTAEIDRLRRTREEVASLLRQSAPIDLPPGLGRAVAQADVPAAERLLAVVMAQVLGPSVIDAYARTLRAGGAGFRIPAFDRLPPDAGERTRRELAERCRLTPRFRRLLAAFPSAGELCADAPRGERHARRALTLALLDLYNPAQIDVLLRVHALEVHRSPAVRRAGP
ncbi:MerR family transcriptional regulator [Streptomyces sp. NPDC049916]|uniref:MerR family transcriptional regulator n=1 Tax=Streptomyces sp. NPDC049916 TaxID=3155156 RepID=UPI0034416190